MADEAPQFRAGISLVGATFLKLLNDLSECINRNRVLIGPQSGLSARQTPGGLLVYGGNSGQGRVAKTTSSITVLSGTAPGSGTVMLQDFDGSNYSDSGATVKAYNMLPFTIASGQYVGLMRVEGGFYHIVLAACT